MSVSLQCHHKYLTVPILLALLPYTFRTVSLKSNDSHLGSCHWYGLMFGAPLTSGQTMQSHPFEFVRIQRHNNDTSRKKGHAKSWQKLICLHFEVKRRNTERKIAHNSIQTSSYLLCFVSTTRTQKHLFGWSSHIHKCAMCSKWKTAKNWWSYRSDTHIKRNKIIGSEWWAWTHK